MDGASEMKEVIREVTMETVAQDVVKYWPDCLRYEDALQVAAGRGFDAGYAAATRWHSIEKEGLPTEEGNYLLRSSLPDAALPYDTAPYEKGRDISHWRRFYTHYQRIEFTEDV